MGIGQLFMRVWRMNVSKSLGRNVSQEEMNRVLKIILIFFFLILVLIGLLVYLFCNLCGAKKVKNLSKFKFFTSIRATIFLKHPQESHNDFFQNNHVLRLSTKNKSNKSHLFGFSAYQLNKAMWYIQPSGSDCNNSKILHKLLLLTLIRIVGEYVYVFALPFDMTIHTDASSPQKTNVRFYFYNKDYSILEYLLSCFPRYLS